MAPIIVQNQSLIELISGADRANVIPAKQTNAPGAAAMDASRTAPDALILEIAQRRFFIETLETRNSDSLDFHDVAVWAIRAALEEAFEAGRRAVEPNTTEP
jgi:hypothetical protein